MVIVGLDSVLMFLPPFKKEYFFLFVSIIERTEYPVPSFSGNPVIFAQIGKIVDSQIPIMHTGVITYGLIEAVRLLPAEELIILTSFLGPDCVKRYTVNNLFS